MRYTSSLVSCHCTTVMLFDVVLAMLLSILTRVGQKMKKKSPPRLLASEMYQQPTPRRQLLKKI